MKKNEIADVNDIIESYLNSLVKNKIIIDTNNIIFDSIVGLKINDLKSLNININISIFIEKNIFYNDLRFINLIVQLLNQFEKVKYLNL